MPALLEVFTAVREMQPREAFAQRRRIARARDAVGQRPNGQRKAYRNAHKQHGCVIDPGRHGARTQARTTFLLRVVRARSVSQRRTITIFILCGMWHFRGLIV